MKSCSKAIVYILEVWKVLEKGCVVVNSQRLLVGTLNCQLSVLCLYCKSAVIASISIRKFFMLQLHNKF